MVAVSIGMTVVGYLFVIKYVLNHVSKTVTSK